MAISLSQFSRPEKRAKLITLCGEGGVGKTSLAAAMPDPVVVRFEDGVTEAMTNVICSPVIRSSTDLEETLRALYDSEHDRKTLVFDSITQANILFEAEVVAGDPSKPKSINQANGGYGAGYGAVSELHRRLRDWAGAFQTNRAMNVVFIAHAESENIDLPDHEPYMRYTLRMNRRCVSHYTDNVDCVGFIKLNTILRTGKDRDAAKKATTDGSRIITCYPTPSHVSKNRFGIETDLIFEKGGNPFAEYMTTPEAKKEA